MGWSRWPGEAGLPWPLRRPWFLCAVLGQTAHLRASLGTRVEDLVLRLPRLPAGGPAPDSARESVWPGLGGDRGSFASSVKPEAPVWVACTDSPHPAATAHGSRGRGKRRKEGGLRPSKKRSAERRKVNQPPGRRMGCKPVRPCQLARFPILCRPGEPPPPPALLP